MIQRRAARLSFSVLALFLAIGQASAQNAGTRVAMNPHVRNAVDLIYQDAEVEIAFCLQATYDSTTNTYYVATVYVAQQADRSDKSRNRGAVVVCAGAQGLMHNHPGAERYACGFHEDDRRALIGGGYELFIGWCPVHGGRLFYALNLDGRFVEGRGTVEG